MDEVTFLEYLSYPFVRNALVAGVLISLCAALLGVPLVLRRLSFMGDGLRTWCSAQWPWRAR